MLDLKDDPALLLGHGLDRCSRIPLADLDAWLEQHVPWQPLDEPPICGRDASYWARDIHGRWAGLCPSHTAELRRDQRDWIAAVTNVRPDREPQ